jgi:hypothetical protein
MHKSFINSLLIYSLIICGSLLLLSCSKSDEQRQFEEEALSPPFTGITEMNEHCKQTEGGETDQSDWRTSPDFAGLITIQCGAYPNPVQYDQNFFIDIEIPYTDTVDRLAFYAIDPNTVDQNMIFLKEETNLSIQDSYLLNSGYFANNSGVSTSNVYRILIYDGRDNLISYGDVQVGGQ